MINHNNKKLLNNNFSKQYFNFNKKTKSEGLNDNLFYLNNIGSSNSNSPEHINTKNNIFDLDENKDNQLFNNEIHNFNSIKQYKNIKLDSSNPPKIIKKYIKNTFENVNSQLKKIKEYNAIQSNYINIFDLNCCFLESQIKQLKLLNKKRKNSIQEKIREIKCKYKI
jgi:hypothetical protein